MTTASSQEKGILDWRLRKRLRCAVLDLYWSQTDQLPPLRLVVDVFTSDRVSPCK